MNNTCDVCGNRRYVDAPLPGKTTRVTCESCNSVKEYEWCPGCLKYIVTSNTTCGRCDTPKNEDEEIGRKIYIQYGKNEISCHIDGKQVVSVHKEWPRNISMTFVDCAMLCMISDLSTRITKIEATLDTLSGRMKQLFDVVEFLPGQGSLYQEASNDFAIEVKKQ